MKKILKRNQVIIAALAIMIVVAGYLELSGRGAEQVQEGGKQAAENAAPESSQGEFSDISEDESIPVADDGSLLLEENAGLTPSVTEAANSGEENPKAADSEENEDAPGSAVLANTKVGGDYFASSKLGREQVRAQNRETLMAIVDDKNISEEQKQKAMDELVRMTKTAEQEDVIETLLEAKGFSDAIVRIEGESADVIVNAATITDAEVAVIEDIVMRKTGMKASQIVVNHAVMED